MGHLIMVTAWSILVKKVEKNCENGKKEGKRRWTS
jgi:hypothetical protein